MYLSGYTPSLRIVSPFECQISKISQVISAIIHLSQSFGENIKVCRKKNTIYTDFNVLQKQRLIKHTNSMSCTLGRLVLSNEIDPEAKGMSSDKTEVPLLWIEHSASRILLAQGQERTEVDFSLALSQMS
jgi:hypothetical protein